MNDKDVIIGALQGAKEKHQVEKVFDNYNISSCEEKIKYLEEAMYNPKVFFSSGDISDIEVKYKTILDVFIIGKWRIYDLYKKAGLVKNNNE